MWISAESNVLELNVLVFFEIYLKEIIEKSDNDGISGTI